MTNRNTLYGAEAGMENPEQAARIEAAKMAELAAQSGEKDFANLEEASIWNLPGRIKDKYFKAVETSTKAREEWLKSGLELNPVKGIGRKFNALKLAAQGTWKGLSAFGGAVVDTVKGGPQPVQSIF